MFTTGINFTPANDSDVEFNPARVTKADAVEIGHTYYNAVADGNEKAQEAILNECGAVLTRRGLRAFANTVLRMGHKDVAKAAFMLRDDITVVAHNAKTA